MGAAQLDRRRYVFLLLVLLVLLVPALLLLVRMHRPILLSNPGGDLLITLAEVLFSNPSSYHPNQPETIWLSPSSDLKRLANILDTWKEKAYLKGGNAASPCKVRSWLSTSSNKKQVKYTAGPQRLRAKQAGQIGGLTSDSEQKKST